MPRNAKGYESMRMAKLKRQKALDRNELRGPSEPRSSAAGVTSLAVKVQDPDLRKLIDEELARRSIENRNGVG